MARESTTSTLPKDPSRAIAQLWTAQWNGNPAKQDEALKELGQALSQSFRLHQRQQEDLALALGANPLWKPSNLSEQASKDPEFNDSTFRHILYDPDLQSNAISLAFVIYNSALNPKEITKELTHLLDQAHQAGLKHLQPNPTKLQTSLEYIKQVEAIVGAHRTEIAEWYNSHHALNKTTLQRLTDLPEHKVLSNYGLENLLFVQRFAEEFQSNISISVRDIYINLQRILYVGYARGQRELQQQSAESSTSTRRLTPTA